VVSHLRPPLQLRLPHPFAPFAKGWESRTQRSEGMGHPPKDGAPSVVVIPTRVERMGHPPPFILRTYERMGRSGMARGFASAGTATTAVAPSFRAFCERVGITDAKIRRDGPPALHRIVPFLNGSATNCQSSS